MKAMAHGTSEGFKLLAMGLLKEAAREFDKALATHPEDGPALLGLARIHLAQHRPREARPLLERLLALHPRHPEARSHKARLRVELDGDAGGLKELRALAARAKAGFPEFYNLGHVLLLVPGQEEEAAQAFVQALKVSPKHPHALTQLGVAVGRLGRLGEALKCFKYAATLAPREALPLQLAARVLVRQGQVGQAQMVLGRAIGRAPQKVELHEEFVKLCLFANTPKPALQSVLELRRLEPHNAQWVYLHGLVALLSGKVEDARRLFREALERLPDSWEVRLALSKALRLGKGKDAAEALKLLEEAVALAPTEPGPSNELAVLLLEKPETTPRALELLQRVLAVHPEDAGAHLNMALALARTDKAAAARHATQARGSTDPGIREQAERLLKLVA